MGAGRTRPARGCSSTATQRRGRRAGAAWSAAPGWPHAAADRRPLASPGRHLRRDDADRLRRRRRRPTRSRGRSPRGDRRRCARRGSPPARAVAYDELAVYPTRAHAPRGSRRTSPRPGTRARARPTNRRRATDARHRSPGKRARRAPAGPARRRSLPRRGVAGRRRCATAQAVDAHPHDSSHARAASPRGDYRFTRARRQRLRDRPGTRASSRDRQRRATRPTRRTITADAPELYWRLGETPRHARRRRVRPRPHRACSQPGRASARTPAAWPTTTTPR